MLEGIKIGFALTGSHCTIAKIFEQIEKLKESGAEVKAIISPSLDCTDTRFGKAEHWKQRLNEITGCEIIDSIVMAEPIGPENLFDVLVIAPCTGNTLAKLANGITDSTVLMATKAHLRNQQPLVLSISTNDGLGLNAKNIGTLINTKNIYLVPFSQDSPYEKSSSLVAVLDLLIPTINAALDGKQYQPLIVATPDKN